MTPSEEFRRTVADMQGADGAVLVTVRLSSVRHAAIMLDRETSPPGKDESRESPPAGRENSHG